MSFKIAVDAGHGLGTAGKRLDKRLDPAETREWVLNDRVVRHFIEAAKQYEGVEILRVDDPTGKTDVSLATRVKRANDWDADLYFSAHHNAGIKLGSGGGIVAYCYKEGTTAAKYRDAIYKACIAAGGLKGNRSDPTLTANFYVIKYTKSPAVLMEYGFMDSRTDVPVILQESYSKLVAYATMEGIAKEAGLKSQPKPTQTQTPKQVDSAQEFDKALAGTYKVKALFGLNLRTGASTSKKILETMKNGSTVRCYGYSTGKWLLVVSASGKTGFCHKSYLKKI